MGRAYDRLKAGAESRLEALDDLEAADEPLAPVTDAAAPADVAPPEESAVDPDDYGIHVDDPETDLMDEDLDIALRDDAEADALDALAESFNARDLDGLMQAAAPDAEAPGPLGYDVANLAEAIEDLWQRRPTCCLTRGHHADEHIGVLWEHDGDAWWRVAAVHVDDVGEGTFGVLEFSDDAALLDELIADPPDARELEEGARWSEWEEGADGDT